MNFKMCNGFEGWYFHHQKGNTTLSFIPGHTRYHSFIQVISSEGSYQFNTPDFTIENGIIKASGCTFSKKGCHIHLPGIDGQIQYKGLTPLRSDIMGPFRFLPMQCRHGVISMHHSLIGHITMNGMTYDFTNGNGYIELDSGFSFPKSYLWLQCNDFNEPCALMLSLAHIPFGITSFTGCICAIQFQNREYRLSTYTGVRILVFQPDLIYLLQGHLLFKVAIYPQSTGHPLRSPIKGAMLGTIRESNNARIQICLWNKGHKVFDLTSNHAMYEYVP